MTETRENERFDDWHEKRYGFRPDGEPLWESRRKIWLAATESLAAENERLRGDLTWIKICLGDWPCEKNTPTQAAIEYIEKALASDGGCD